MKIQARNKVVIRRAPKDGRDGQDGQNGLPGMTLQLNPERIVLGGAVMAERQYLAPRILADLEEAVPRPFRSATQLAFAELGNDAGLMGALYHFLQRRRDVQERAQNRETGEAGKVR